MQIIDLTRLIIISWSDTNSCIDYIAWFLSLSTTVVFFYIFVVVIVSSESLYYRRNHIVLVLVFAKWECICWFWNNVRYHHNCFDQSVFLSISEFLNTHTCDTLVQIQYISVFRSVILYLNRFYCIVDTIIRLS